MSRTAVYTGTFDPPTLGHIDLIARAARMVDRLVIGVANNSSKSPLFSLSDRVRLLDREIGGLGSMIEVLPFEGLAVDFARKVGAQLIVRGLRSGADLDYETPMASMNGVMAPQVDTVFLVARPAFAHIASSLVKDVARGGGPIEQFVPAAVAAEIIARTR